MLKSEPVAPVFLVDAEELTVAETVVVTLDELNASHNRQRVKIPIAMVLHVAATECLLVSPGGTKTTIIRCENSNFEERMLVCELNAVVTIGMGAVASLDLLDAVILQREAVLENCSWPDRADMRKEVGIYTFPVNTPKSLNLEVSPRCKGVIWRCPASHFNATAAAGGCKSCGHAQLLPEYDCVLYAKGRGFGQFVRLGMTETVVSALVGTDHSRFVLSDGTADLQGISSALHETVKTWKLLLVRCGFPDSVGKRTNATHQILAAH